MFKRQNPFRADFFRHIGLITQLGTSVVLSIILSILGFNYLDSVLDTRGVLKIAGVLIGVIIGMLAAYRQLKKYYEKNDINHHG